MRMPKRLMAGGLAVLCATGTVGAQGFQGFMSNTTPPANPSLAPGNPNVGSFSPSAAATASTVPGSFWDRLFNWLPSFGSSTPTTQAVAQRSGYNGVNPGDMMSSRPMMGTPVGKYRPIQQ